MGSTARLHVTGCNLLLLLSLPSQKRVGERGESRGMASSFSLLRLLIIYIVMLRYKFFVVRASDTIITTEFCGLKFLLPYPFPNSRDIDAKIFCYFLGC